MLIVVFCNSCWFVPSGAPRFGVVPALCNREVWQSSDMTYPAVNDPNITSGFTFNKRSLSLASELRCFVVLRPSPEQSAPSAVRYNIIIGDKSGLKGLLCFPSGILFIWWSIMWWPSSSRPVHGYVTANEQEINWVSTKTKTPSQKSRTFAMDVQYARNLHFGIRKHQKDAYLGKRSGSSFCRSPPPPPPPLPKSQDVATKPIFMR